MRKAPFNLIVLGDPGSGKATQAAYLVKKYHLRDLDMGKEVMKPAARARHDFAKTTAKGKLTPTHVVRDIFERVIKTTPQAQGILFNGTPKMIGEAKLVARLLREHGRRDPFVMYLKIPMREILRRTAKRRISVRGKLVKRDDDQPEALKNRRKYYDQQISKVVAFFKSKYEFRDISGMGSRSEVQKRIAAILRRHLEEHSKMT
jgi:adenylate kinase family enzyme